MGDSFEKIKANESAGAIACTDDVLQCNRRSHPHCLDQWPAWSKLGCVHRNAAFIAEYRATTIAITIFMLFYYHCLQMALAGDHGVVSCITQLDLEFLC
eukprot:SAG31_NODE_19794_length_591_cov_1.095528_1_plen_99_part_00